MGPKKRKRGRDEERRLTAQQQRQMNREGNLRRGATKQPPAAHVDGTPWTAEEFHRIAAATHQPAQPNQSNESERKRSNNVGGEVTVVRRGGRSVRMRILPLTPSELLEEEKKQQASSSSSSLGVNAEMLELFRAMGAQHDIDEAELDQKKATLGPSQLQAYIRTVEKHETVFITGGAGTGKTHVLKCIIAGLRLSKKVVAVMAPTGVAAHRIEGITVHSFMKLAPIWYDRPLASVLQHFKKKPAKLLPFETVHTIVIDEVSMVQAKILEWLDHILQYARKNTKPFGGVQVIVCGDFFQLPPVASQPKAPPKPNPQHENLPNDDADDDGARLRRGAALAVARTLEAARLAAAHAAEKSKRGYPTTWWKEDQHPPVEVDAAAEQEQGKKLKRERPAFCFESHVWIKVFTPDKCIQLQENFRQHTDTEFIQLLNNARRGKMTEQDIKALDNRHLNTRKRLLAENRRQSYSSDMSNFRVRLFSTCAQVESHNDRMRKSVQRADNPSKVYHTSYVLRPWSDKQIQRIEEQKLWFAQNREQLRKDQMLFYAEMLFEYDVSREDALEKLDDDVSVSDRVELCVGTRVMLMKNWQTSKGLVHGRTGWVVGFGQDGPLVVFDDPSLDWTLPDAMARYTAQAIEVPPIEWSAMCSEGRVVAAQVPLSYAWAITIHKSQGLSLSRADMDLAYLFEAGQGYVALSRLTTLPELGLLDFRADGIYADPRVLGFYEHCFHEEKPTPRPAWLALTPIIFPALPQPIVPPAPTPPQPIGPIGPILPIIPVPIEPSRQQPESGRVEPQIRKVNEQGAQEEKKSGEFSVGGGGGAGGLGGWGAFSSARERAHTEQLLTGRFGADFVAFLRIHAAATAAAAEANKKALQEEKSRFATDDVRDEDDAYGGAEHSPKRPRT